MRTKTPAFLTLSLSLCASALLVGCASKPAPAFSEGDVDTAQLGTCQADPDNSTRATCTVNVTSPTRIEVEMDLGMELVTEARQVEAGQTSFTVNGLIADTVVQWSLASEDNEQSGELHTAKQGDAHRVPLKITDSGRSTVKQVLLPGMCGESSELYVVDAKGHVRWYGDLDPEGRASPSWVTALSVSDEGTFVGMVGDSRIAEVTLDGELGLELERGRDFDLPVHHDLSLQGGRLRALMADEITAPDGIRQVVDGVYTFDAEGALEDEWLISDHLTLPLELPPDATDNGVWKEEWPGAYDVTHANSLAVDAQGDLLISARHLDAVIHVKGLDDAEPGRIDWTLAASGIIPSTFRVDSAVQGSSTFASQHHATWIDGTHLRLFNNGGPFETPSSVPSTALSLSLDPVAGVATIEESVSYSSFCDFGGSAYPLPSGNLLLSCSEGASAIEVEPSGEVVWRMVADCGGSPAVLVRAIPVDLF